MKLIFVYLGRKIPHYAFLNLVLTAKKFPEHDVILVSNYAVEKPKQSPNVDIFRCNDPANTWGKVRDMSSHPESFRDDFWFKTVARFYAIYEYMENFPNDSILHIESDVWLSSLYPLDKIAKIKQPIAYPLTTLNEGVASTLFLKDLRAARNLIAFSESQISINAHATDVTILGSLHEIHPTEVFILPTAPKTDLCFNVKADIRVRQKMSENFGIFGGVFDASTWGQFLFGHDGRNRVGISPTFMHQEHHSISTRDVRFDFEYPDRLYLLIDKLRVPIYSLHIHSKNQLIFQPKFEAKVLRQSAVNSSKGIRYNIDVRLFVKLLPNFLFFILKKTVRKLLKSD